MGTTPLSTLTARELIDLLTATEEQIRRLRDGSGSRAESPARCGTSFANSTKSSASCAADAATIPETSLPI